MQSKASTGIGVWANDTKNGTVLNTGKLTAEQIKLLGTLKAGDRLAVYENGFADKDTSPTHILRVQPAKS